MSSLVESIRAQFPILATKVNQFPLIYFDNAATTQRPQMVIDAISNFYATSNANVHRGVHYLSEIATQQYEAARSKVAKFLNAKESSEVVFVRGTTEGINLVANSLRNLGIKAGDEIIISQMEHHSNIVPWQMLCEATGAVLKVIPINTSGEFVIAEYQKLLTQKTKLVAVNYVSNAIGTINPVAEIIKLAHANNTPVLIDAAQAAAHVSIDVQQLDCDFLAISAHKMFGPTGIGALYAKKSWLEKLPPYQGGGEMIEFVSLKKSSFAKPPFKFEAGTPNIAGSIGFAAAIDFIQQIGFDKIRQHEQELLAYATSRLQEIPKIHIIGTAKNKVSVISFNIEGVHHQDLGLLLDQFGIAIRTGHHCAMPLFEFFGIEGSARVSLSIYNTFEEIDFFINKLNHVIEMLQ